MGVYKETDKEQDRTMLGHILFLGTESTSHHISFVVCEWDGELNIPGWRLIEWVRKAALLSGRPLNVCPKGFPNISTGGGAGGGV